MPHNPCTQQTFIEYEDGVETNGLIECNRTVFLNTDYLVYKQVLLTLALTFFSVSHPKSRLESDSCE